MAPGLGTQLPGAGTWRACPWRTAPASRWRPTTPSRVSQVRTSRMTHRKGREGPNLALFGRFSWPESGESDRFSRHTHTRCGANDAYTKRTATYRRYIFLHDSPDSTDSDQVVT